MRGPLKDREQPIAGDLSGSSQTTTFKIGDKVRMARDYGTSFAVPLGREGKVAEVGMWGTYIVVDFGHPWGERGCRDGSSLEIVRP